MKNIFKYILAAAAVSFAATACVEEETHPYGESDVDGCYGVYFPAQETKLTLDPEAETAYTLIVSRSKTDGSITVPYSVISESDVFTLGEISFDDGQKETNLNIDFSKSEVGVEYSVSIKIDDPQYASKYATGATSIDFSILREKWNSLGKAKYTEDFVTTFYAVSNVQYEVEIQENASTKGLFRLVNPYGAAYPYNEAGDWDDSKNYYMVINAITPNMVYIDYFDSGMDWGNGNFFMWSLADYYMSQGKTIKEVYEAGLTGTYADGIITFPERTLLVGQPNKEGGALYYGNTNGAFKIVMPGVVEVDYSIEMEAELTFDGEVPVAFYTGVDVDKIRFKAYEGRLNTAEKNNALEAIIAGSEDGTAVIEAVADDPETKDIEYAEAYLSFDKTGVYTLVAATLDAEGNGQEGDVIEFTYVAPDDEEKNAVVLSCGVELTSAYEVLGKDRTNSAQVYITGEDVTELYYYMFPTSTVEKNGLEACVAAMKSNMKPISEEELAEVNGSVYVKLVDKLTPKTAYTLVVYATNGYSEAVVTAEIETDGLPLIELGKASWKSEMWKNPENYLTDVVTDPNIKDEYRVYFDEQWFYCVVDKDKKTVNVPLQRMTAYDSSSSIYIIETRDFYKIMEEEGADELPVSSYSDQKDMLTLMVSYIVLSDADGKYLGDFGDMSEVFSKPETAQSQSRLSISNIDFNNCELNNDFKTEKKFEIPVKVEERENCHTAVGAEFTIRKVTSATKSEIRNLENRFDSGINKLN